MEGLKDQSSTESVVPQAVADQMQVMCSGGDQYNNGMSSVWLKPVTVKSHSNQANSAEQETSGGTYILPQIVQNPGMQQPSSESCSNSSPHLVVSSEQSNATGYLDNIQQMRLIQMELEQHENQMTEQQENDNNLEIAKQFVNQIRSWSKASQSADKGPDNLMQNPCQPTHIVTDTNQSQPVVLQTVQDVTQMSSENMLGAEASISRSQTINCQAKSVDAKDCIFIPVTSSESSNNYIINAAQEDYSNSLAQERKVESVKYEICAIPDQEKILDTITHEALQTLIKTQREPLAKKSDQWPVESLTKKESSGACGTAKVDEKKPSDGFSGHDKNKILALLNDTLVQFCHNNLYFVEFVHMTGRMTFNLDSRETIQLVVSQMATPQAFTDDTSPSPSDSNNRANSRYIPAKRKSNKTSKCVRTQKRGGPRKGSSRSTPLRKRSVKVESASSDTHVTIPLSGRRAAADARKKLAETVPVHGDDASSTVVNMTDSNVTDDGDEDYVPNDVTGEETSPDDQILQPSDEQSDVTPENEIKKEEPDDSGEDRHSALEVEKSDVRSSENPESYKYQCVHCQRRFQSEPALRKHVETHKPLTCSEPECGELTFCTRSAIRKHFRDTHGRQAKELHRCEECRREFLSEEQLRLHVHEPPSGHRCLACGESYEDESSLRRHRDRCHPERSCHVCGKEFSSKVALGRHLRKHKDKAAGGGGKVKCADCDKEFASHSSLFHHKKAVHSGAKPYQCTECGLTFNFNNSLKLHRLKHSGLRPYKCDVCDKSYLTASHLKNHVQALHSADKLYACPICDKRFPYDNSLKLHMRLHTGDRPFMCAVCSKTFVSKGALKVHEASHVDSRDYRCDICSKSYKTEALMRVHRRRHTADSSRYMCDICGNTYMYKSNLEVHYEVHSDTKRHKCKVCGKMFKTNPALHSHYLVHSDREPFTCNQCGKSFKTKERLKAHSIRHSGLKPYVCDQCGSSFPDKGGLTKHRKTVHAEVARYACPVCRKPCNRADNLRVHMKVHGDPSLLKLSLEELAAARKCADGECKSEESVGERSAALGTSLRCLVGVKAKFGIDAKPEPAAGQPMLHVMEAARGLDVRIPVPPPPPVQQHPAPGYLHADGLATAIVSTQQQQQQAASEQPPVVTDPAQEAVSTQTSATPFVSMHHHHHWPATATDGAALQYQNLLLSQGYPAASMVPARQVHSLDDANTVVYQTTAQQDTGHNTQY